MSTGHEEEMRPVPVAKVHPSPFQTRKSFDEAHIDQLAASMVENTLLQPIVVRPKDGEFQLIAGECRWRAAKKLKWTSITAIVRTVSDKKAALMTAVENLQRKDLPPLEEAEGYQQLMEKFKLTQVQLHEMTGIPRTTIQSRVGLLAIGEAWLTLLKDGALTVSQAVEVQRFRKRSAADHAKAIMYVEKHGAESIDEIPLATFKELVAAGYGETPAAKKKPKKKPATQAGEPDEQAPAVGLLVPGSTGGIFALLEPITRDRTVRFTVVAGAGESRTVVILPHPHAGDKHPPAPFTISGTAAEIDAGLTTALDLYIDRYLEANDKPAAKVRREAKAAAVAADAAVPDLAGVPVAPGGNPDPETIDLFAPATADAEPEAAMAAGVAE